MTSGVEKKQDSQQELNYEEQLNKINSKVTDLVDENKENDDWAKQELWTLLNTEFLAWLNSYFAEHPEKKDEFKNNVWESVKQLVEKFEKENGWNVPDELKPLLDFAKDIWVELKDNSKVDNLVQPKLELTWSLWEVEKVTINEGDPQDKKWAQDFFSKIHLKNGKEEVSRLDETINNISSLLTSVNAINLEDSSVPEEIKNNINNIKNLLASVQDVINNTTPENVKTLQNYIFENIEDKELFKKKNKYDGVKKEFDWKFWESTLDGLNEVLRKTSEYIKNVPDYLNKLKEDASKKEDEEKEEQNRIEAEKQQKVKDVIEWLELTVVDVDAEVRKNYKLPEKWDIYEREWNQWYYYIENSEYVVYVPLEKSYPTRVLKISEYKKWTEYNDEPRKDKTDSSTENAGNTTNSGNEVGTESENGTVDINTLVWTIKAQLWLHPAENIDRASLWLPSNWVIYMGSWEFYYYIAPENNKLIRVSPKWWRSYLDLNQYNKNHKIDWVSEDWLYPEISEENREYYERILNDSIRGIDRFKKYNWSIDIDYDPFHKRQEYKIVSSLWGNTFSNFIDADMLTTWWVFKGEDHLKKDLRVYCLVLDLALEYKKKMKNCRFDLINNELIHIDRFWNRKREMDRREWNKYWNNWELAGNNARRFCNYLNRCSWGIYYVEEQQTITSSWKPSVVEQTSSVPQWNEQTSSVPQWNQWSLDSNPFYAVAPGIGMVVDVVQNNLKEGVEFTPSWNKENPEQVDTVSTWRQDTTPQENEYTEIDLSNISSEIPKKFWDPKEIKSVCFEDVIRESENLSSRFQNLIFEAFNIAIDNVNALEDSDEKKEKIQILNLLKEWFTKPDINYIENWLHYCRIINSNSPNKFELVSLRQFFHYFNIKFEGDWLELWNKYSKLRDDVTVENEKRSKETLMNEANDFKMRLAEKLPNLNDRKAFLLYCDTREFIRKYSETWDRNFLTCIARYLDEDMVKHYEWNGARTEKWVIKYKYEWKGLNCNTSHPFPVWVWKITFRMPWSDIEESYLWNWDESGNLKECKSYWEEIKIWYDADWGPYFKNDFWKLKISWKGTADVWMIANKINYMVSKLRMNGEIDKVSIMLWKLFVKFDSWKIMNLKDNVRETMYIDDSMSDLEISQRFHRYFDEKLSGIQSI